MHEMETRFGDGDIIFQLWGKGRGMQLALNPAGPTPWGPTLPDVWGRCGGVLR